MRHSLAAFAAVVTMTAATLAIPPAAKHFDGQTWWAHVKVLADDNMEGRDTGSPGLKRAEAYAVEQLKAAGLTPAGTKGFYQPVHFVSRLVDEKHSYATLVDGNKKEPLRFGEDCFLSTRSDPSAGEMTTPMVFVGNGLQVPEKNYDDLAGLDLKGKIAVLLTGSPAEIPGPLAAHYGLPKQRWKGFRKAGAVGIIAIPNPAAMDLPWSRIASGRTQPSMQLAGAEFVETPGLKVALVYNPAEAEKLFTGSGHTFAEIAALGKEQKVLPKFPLAAKLQTKVAVTSKPIESANVIAKLPGADPNLKNEYVVLSAHIDHVGVGEPINGDRIYNGAMDNASGTAVVLDVAAELKAHPVKLRRSLLFVLVTGEEKGLLGSEYFGAHPTVSTKSMVADINMDMFLPVIPCKTLMVLGIKESTLGDRMADVARSFDAEPMDDPEPQRNLFVRSDQYNFIVHGVPAIAPVIFAEPGTPDDKVIEKWLQTRYHAPSDDLKQPVNLPAAAKYEEMMRSLMVEVANTDAKPEWHENSFFKRYANSGEN